MTTKQSSGKHVKSAAEYFVVATNSEYAKLCTNSVNRLSGRKNVEVLSFATMEDVEFHSSRPDSTLFVSRLSDISPFENRSIGASVKHLLFLEGLPVEAVPARVLGLNIRNPRRLHIAALRDRTSMADLVHRLISGMTQVDDGLSIVDAWIENEQLVLLSPSFARLVVPLEKLARFIGTNESKAAKFEIDEDGRFLHWAHADVHLGWTQFQQIIDPASVLAQANKTEEFNQRYGAAIRSVRESQGLKQAAIQGITERHLRRVEHGENAVSKATLAALAKAHSLSLDDYLNQLAKCVATIH